jgi:uncharacterized protein (TIGR02679 family)
MLESVCNALNDLPSQQGEAVSLTEFALRHNKDAHAFDINGELGPLFLRALSRRYDTPYPATSEESSALYYMAGLLTEGVLNRVAVRGLKAWRGETPDIVNDLYNQWGESHILTLEQVSRFSRVQANGGKVYVIENLPVFSAVTEKLHGSPCSVICIENGLNAAALCLLDLLAASEAVIYYSGDMDYPGLALADKIYLRHPKQFRPWRYGKGDYENILSKNEFFLPDHKRDQGLHNDDLAALLSLLRKRGKTAPQMALAEDLVKDLTGE